MRKEFLRAASRSLAAALSLCLGLALCPAPARAATEAPANLQYVLPCTKNITPISDFQEGIAAVSFSGGSEGYITSEGKTIASQLFKAFPFREGRALALIGNAQMEAAAHNADGTVTLSALTPVGTNTGYYYVTVNTQGAITPILQRDVSTGKDDYVSLNDLEIFTTQSVGGFFSAGYSSIGMDNRLTMLPEYAVTREDGSVYDGGGLICSSPATEGLRVCNIEALSWNSSVYIDDSGKIVLDLLEPEFFGPVHEIAVETTALGRPIKQSYRQVTDLRPFNQGLAPALQTTYEYSADIPYNESEFTSHWGFIDKSGKWIIQPQYLSFMVSDKNVTYTVFNDGIAMVKNTDELWGGIDKTGKTVVPFQYEACNISSQGLIAVKKGEVWGAVDGTGKTVVPFVYEDTFFFHEGLARVEQGGKYGFVDLTGNLVVPCQYEDADSGCFNGMVWVKKDGKAGYLNAKGTIAVPFLFDEARRFQDGVAFVKNAAGEYGVLANPLNAPKFTMNQAQLNFYGWRAGYYGSATVYYTIKNMTDSRDVGCYALVGVGLGGVIARPFDYDIGPNETQACKLDLNDVRARIYELDDPGYVSNEENTAAWYKMRDFDDRSSGILYLVKFSSETERNAFLNTAPWQENKDWSLAERVADNGLHAYTLVNSPETDQWLSKNFDGLVRPKANPDDWKE